MRTLRLIRLLKSVTVGAGLEDNEISISYYPNSCFVTRQSLPELEERFKDNQLVILGSRGIDGEYDEFIAWLVDKASISEVMRLRNWGMAKTIEDRFGGIPNTSDLVEALNRSAEKLLSIVDNYDRIV